MASNIQSRSGSPSRLTRWAALAAGLSAVAVGVGGVAAAAGTDGAAPADKGKSASAPAAGTRNLGSYSVVTGTSVSIPANGGYVFASATCPSGRVALGGGGSNSSYGRVLMTDSRPSGTTGWGVWMRNDGTTTASATAYVTCGS